MRKSFYREATAEDFKLSDLPFNHLVPILEENNKSRDTIIRDLHKQYDIPFTECERIIKDTESFIQAKKDFDNGKVVIVKY